MKEYVQVGVVHRNSAGQISIKGITGYDYFDISKYVGQRLFVETEISVEEYRKVQKATLKAVLHHNNVWPKELTSGVMFFDGCRITYKEFMEMAN